ncbi:MAG TPA: methylmalonyl-CoA mutase family protein [Methylocystis sp.]|nr:methylmalonyl-CoA mutase family protein [Methylocystis sp.]
MPDQSLAADFPQATQEQWRKSVDRALKGGAFEKLVAKTYEGAEIAPLYPRAAAPGERALRRKPGRWSILARVDLADPEAANAQALEELNGGADGLQLVFRGSQGAYGTALAGDDEATLAQVLANVRLEYGVPLALEASPAAPNAAESLLRFIDKIHVEPSITRASFGFDPLGAQLRHGFALSSWSEGAKLFAREAKRVANLGFDYGVAAVDARAVHAAGGTNAQQLGYALACGLAYLRALSEGGVDLDKARGLLLFRLAVDADEFAETAKLRALRRLWALVEESCGLKPQPALIHAETAWRMMTKNDPWTNLLRTTIATFAAAVGGADALAVIPFTQPLGVPDAFARRLARDTQLVLEDESHLHVVDDPAAGAGGFEALTDDLCARAWAEFQAIEAEGGLAKALEAGRFQAQVASLAGERAKNVARAKDKITGANEFPDIGEAALSVLAPFVEVGRLEAPAGALRTAALEPLRLAEPFEALREAAAAHYAKTGVKPRVFLANLGPVAAFTARSNFAKNFFEAGGVEAVSGPETEDLLSIVKAYRESGAKLACLCSSDRIYCDAAAAVALALHGTGATLYLAGRPGELEEELRKAGVTRFIFAGCDMLGSLQRALEEAK